MNKFLWVILGAVALFTGGVTVSKVYWPNVQVVDRTDSLFVDSVSKAYAVKDLVYKQTKDSFQILLDKKPTVIIKKVPVPIIVKKDSLITVTKDRIVNITNIVTKHDTVQLEAPLMPEIGKTQYGADNYVYSNNSGKIVVKLRTKYLLHGESLYIYNGENLEDPLVTYYDYRTIKKKNVFSTSSVYILCVSDDKDVLTRFQKLIKNKNKL